MKILIQRDIVMVRGIFSQKWILRVIGSFSANVGAVVFGCCIAQVGFNMLLLLSQIFMLLRVLMLLFMQYYPDTGVAVDVVAVVVVAVVVVTVVVVIVVATETIANFDSTGHCHD
jgi:hypothetical protein